MNCLIELKSGLSTPFIALIITFIVFVVSSNYVKKGIVKVTLRILPAQRAIKEMVGRATEMGRSVFITPQGGIRDPQMQASIPAYELTAELCAENGVQVWTTTSNPISYNFIIDLYSDAFRKVGTEFDPSTVLYYPYYTAFTAATIGLMARERPAGHLILGRWAGICTIIMEAANSIGAMQIGGTAVTEQLAFFAVICDYSVLGEEIFAMGASISQDPEDVSAILSEDLLKLVIGVLSLIGVILSLTGSTWLTNILNL